MQLKCNHIGILTIIVAVALTAGCTENGEIINALSCTKMSIGWIESFNTTYGALPTDAAQCEGSEGLIIVAKFSSANDVSTKLKEELLAAGQTVQADYYAEICTTSNEFCLTDLISSEGKINGAGILDGNLIIVVVNSVDSSRAVSFLNVIWAQKSGISNAVA